MSFFESKGWRVTSIFGPRTHPLKKTTEFHKGIDLVKAHLSPVPSFTDGEVIHARLGVSGSGLGSYGNTVAVVEPGTGYLHIYAHLDSCSVKVGDKIKAGTIVGKQGNSGASAGSHLHYEIRKKSRPAFGFGEGHDFVIDPAVYWKDPKYAYGAKQSTTTAAAPKPAAAKPAPTAKSSGAKIYTVKSGDTLGKIASENGTTVAEVLKKNPQIKNANLISVGQKINL